MPTDAGRSTADAHSVFERAAQLCANARRITVLTGAGISTDSGIPDYRGPNGVWTKNPKAERTSSLQHYLNDPEVRQIAWQNRLHSPAWDAQPNAGHAALADLERQGRLHTLVTQNIDELHQQAGSDPARVVEVHGSMRRAVCWSCHTQWPMQTVLDRVRAGDPDPHCECGGVIKSATISFGQQLVAADLQRAFDAAATADLLLAVGTTLAVGPVNQMVTVARSHDVPVVIVNLEPTEMDLLASAVVRAGIADVLPALVGAAQRNGGLRLHTATSPPLPVNPEV